MFNATDSADLRAKLATALAAVADPATREAMRAAIATRISGYTYATAAAGLLSALRAVVRQPSQ